MIGVGTTPDPAACKRGRLRGQLIGRPGRLPDVYSELSVTFTLFEKLIGLGATGKETDVDPLRPNEELLSNVGTTSVKATVKGFARSFAELVLERPVCASPGEKVALSRRIQESWKLIGWAKILTGRIAPFQ